MSDRWVIAESVEVVDDGSAVKVVAGEWLSGSDVGTSASSLGPLQISEGLADRLPSKPVAERWLISVSADDAMPDRAGSVAMVQGSMVAFVGDCAFGLTTSLESAAKVAGSASPLAGFTEFLTNRESEIGRVLTGDSPPPTTEAPLAWSELPTDQRTIEGGNPAPSEVREALHLVELVIPVPGDDWLATGANLCTRSSAGWGGRCTRLSPGRAGEAPFRLRAYAPPGEGLEIVLQDGNSFLDPYFVVGQVGPDLTAGTVVMVELRGAPVSGKTSLEVKGN